MKEESMMLQHKMTSFWLMMADVEYGPWQVDHASVNSLTPMDI